MNVALITEWFNSYEGGVAGHVKNLALILKKNKIDVSIITNKMKEKKDVNLHVYEIEGVKDPMFKLNLSPKITKKMRKILEKNFDVVHCHHAFARLPLTGIHVADKINIPSILTTHTVSLFPDADYLWRPLSYGYPRYRLQISKVKEIIAVSESAKTFIEYFADETKIRVIPNGVDVNRFSPDNKNENNRGLVILYMGRLVPKKGIHILIRAMKNIVKKYPDALLLIGGRGKMKTFLSSYANTLGLKDNVRFLGYVPDSMLPSLYSSSDVFVLPSITAESFGITLLEAMASGTPVVGSNVGGIPEVINNCGFIVEPSSPKKLSDAVITLLDDEDLRKKFGRKGRKRVEEKYSWDIVGKKIIEVYKEVM